MNSRSSWMIAKCMHTSPWNGWPMYDASSSSPSAPPGAPHLVLCRRRSRPRILSLVICFASSGTALG